MVYSKGIVIGFYTEEFDGYDWNEFECSSRKQARRILEEYGLNPDDLERYIRN